MSAGGPALSLPNVPNVLTLPVCKPIDSTFPRPSGIRARCPAMYSWPFFRDADLPCFQLGVQFGANRAPSLTPVEAGFVAPIFCVLGAVRSASVSCPAQRGSAMNDDPQHTSTATSSPGQTEQSEQLLRAYDDLDDAGKQELLKLAIELVERHAT